MRTPMIWRDCKIVVIKIDLTLPSILYIVYNLQTGKIKRRSLMSFSYRRTYRGPIEAVLLDWAGTTMDFGCMAPAVVFVQVYERQKVPITMDEARAPMGAHKKVHIQKISQLDSVRRRWQEVRGRPPNDDDVNAMFAE